jgi:hypothetical protein
MSSIRTSPKRATCSSRVSAPSNSSVPETDRFVFLQKFIDRAYLQGEHLAYTMKGKAGAEGLPTKSPASSRRAALTACSTRRRLSG